MRLTMLGTGSAMPTGRRVQSGYLLESAAGSLLVDCGSGVLHRLARTDVEYAGVDTLLLTHHHLDHVADVLPLLKARWLAGAPPLSIYGPPGTEALLADLLAVHAYLATEVEYLAEDLHPGHASVDGRQVEIYETAHSMQCFAYRIDTDVGDVTFSGDTEADEGLARFADGSRILVHDCSFPDDVDVSNHPTPHRLGEALAGTTIERVILTHLYPHTDGRSREMRQSIRASYDGRVDILEDLEAIQF